MGKAEQGVNRNTTVSEHHTPGPFTEGVKELTSPCDRKGKKERKECEALFFFPNVKCQIGLSYGERS